MWYLIESIPYHCTLTYFVNLIDQKMRTWCFIYQFMFTFHTDESDIIIDFSVASMSLTSFKNCIDNKQRLQVQCVIMQLIWEVTDI